MNLSDGAKKIVAVCAGVKPGETVLIVTDKNRPFSVASALAAAADTIGAKVNVLIAPPLRLPGEEPGDIVAAALKASNVVFSATTQTLGHSASLRTALKGTTRCLALTGCTEQTLMSGAIEADFLKLGPLVDFVKNNLFLPKWFTSVRLAAPIFDWILPTEKRQLVRVSAIMQAK